MINNRQAGRRRGRGGGNNGQRQGGQQGNGSRIDSRARGNANQLFEKYKNMAADAQRAGDRVNTEYYLQFADHYFRVLSEQRGRFEDQQPRARNDAFDIDGDDEFGDEGEPVRGRDPWAEGVDAPRGEVRAEARDRDERPREFRRDEGEPRRNGNGDGRWSERGQDRSQERADRPDRNRDRRPAEPRAEVGGQHRADPVMPGESLNGRAEEVLDADRPLETPAPRRRGRPRREDAPVDQPQGEAANGFEADRLPPALGPAVAANDEEPVAKPRRRRARPAEEAPAAE